MTEQISALIDGELDSAAADTTLQAIKAQRIARTKWDEYALIGDVLRGEPAFSSAFVSSVMATLEAEPTVLAPIERAAVTKRVAAKWERYLPVAATLAGVAVVGWMGLRAEPSPAPLALMRAQPVSVSDADRAYLLVHHGYAGAQVVPAVGYYVRTLSEQGGERTQ